MSLIYLRHCKQCKKVYDIETNYDTCPECRGIKLVVENGKEIS
ncbi:hypothetical protein LCGC14_2278800 [marine sediment metagenome]|uniref:Uncharacterized protein n=1 Tax=marine sediment metagenome TaxID=412755 RepID=A0A0F9CUR3_9ZZZZ